MLNLDHYTNNTTDVTINGKVYKVKEPSTRMLLEMKEIEKDLSTENLHEKRIAVARVILNHNTEGHVFQEEDITEIPFEGIQALVSEICTMRLEAEYDPNSGSPSRTGK